MKVIDSHTHCFPDALAPQALASLVSAYNLTPSFDGTVAGMLRQMDAAGIDAAFNLPVATKAAQVTSINNWVAEIQSPRIIKFGAMHPDFSDPANEVRRMKRLGIKGFKLQPNWQNFYPDDERVFPIYEAAEGEMIVYFHSGYEIDESMEIKAVPERIAEIHKRFPGIAMVVAHMGGHLIWDRVSQCLLGKELYLDTSFCHKKDLEDSRFVAMIQEHGVHKIIFGSDAPCASPAGQLNRVMSLDLTDREKEAIVWKNAARLVGILPNSEWCE